MVIALATLRKGFEVTVFERDVSVVRGESQYRGPIQVQSNALAALEAIDADVADKVRKAGCITGDRINGLVDGIFGSRYVKFDTFTHAVECGLPVTRVISCMTLLGDSVHAMQPNLGQGGYMAIEDSYQLALELEKAWAQSTETRNPIDFRAPLKRYEETIRIHIAIIYGLARMAAIMASTYRPYLCVGFGPLLFLTKFLIPHPGRVGGRFFIKPVMPLMLSWVLGGNSSQLEGRSLSCRFSDKASDQLKKTWFEDDDELERAVSGEWYLFPASNADNEALQPIHLIKDAQTFLIGSSVQDEKSARFMTLPLPQVDEPPRYADVSSRHSRARVEYGVSGGSSQYKDAYDERIGHSQIGYGGGWSSLSGHDSHGLYNSHQGMGYGGGSISSGDAGLYSSSISSSYLSCGSDVGGSSYSSLYSRRNIGSNGYLGGSGFGSYF